MRRQRPTTITKPEETDDYIHIPVRDADDFVEDSFRTITISAERGIKAVIGKLKSDPDGPTHIQKYMFSTEQWDMESAQEWVDEHKDDVLSGDRNGDKEDILSVAARVPDNQPEAEGKMTDMTMAMTPVYATRTLKETMRKFIAFPIDKGKREEDRDAKNVYMAYFTSDQADEMGDIITREATQEAIKKYKRWGNIRYMHMPRPIGKVIGIGEGDNLEWNQIKFKVTDPDVQRDIDEGVLSAMSVGIWVREWEPIRKEGENEDDEDFFWWLGPMRILAYDLIEISVVDHPANYDATITNGAFKLKQKNGDEPIRRTLFDIDPENEFDAAVSYYSLNKKRFDVLVSEDEAEKRTAYVRQKSNDRLIAFHEEEGILNLPVEELRSRWDSLVKANAPSHIFAVARSIPHHSTTEVEHRWEEVDVQMYRDGLRAIEQLTDASERQAAREHFARHREAIARKFGMEVSDRLLLDDNVWGRYLKGLGKDNAPGWTSWLALAASELEMPDNPELDAVDEVVANEPEAKETGVAIESAHVQSTGKARPEPNADADRMDRIEQSLALATEKMDALIEAITTAAKSSQAQPETKPVNVAADAPTVEATGKTAQIDLEGNLAIEKLSKALAELSERFDRELKARDERIQSLSEELEKAKRPTQRKAALTNTEGDLPANGQQVPPKDIRSMSRDELQQQIKLAMNAIFNG